MLNEISYSFNIITLGLSLVNHKFDKLAVQRFINILAIIAKENNIKH